MKKLYFIFAAALAAVTASATLGTLINGNIGLGWSYFDEPANTNLSFNIYYATNLLQPPPTWILATNIVSTAALDTNDVSGNSYRVSLTLPPAAYFFVATASNFWGESGLTSNIIGTPPAPQLINTLKIQKLP